MMFTTLTLNIQNGLPWNEVEPDARQIDLRKTADFLKGQDADVVFLQEVEMGHDGGAQIEPPPNFSSLREALPGYDAVFGYPLKNDTELPFGLGLAIFSKTKLENPMRMDLPAPDIEFEFDGTKRKPSSRLLLGATTVFGGSELTLMNTHLQAFFMIGASSTQHREQRDAVARALSQTHGPTLLAGDFNCMPEEGLIEQFEAIGFQPAQNHEVTWRRMPYVLDHIFYNAGLHLQRSKVVPTLASDHHAVIAEFQFA
jgi:endonuclease/exonuclease/phosphatase family metal-dependent hydrolase